MLMMVTKLVIVSCDAIKFLTFIKIYFGYVSKTNKSSIIKYFFCHFFNRYPFQRKTCFFLSLNHICRKSEKNTTHIEIYTLSIYVEIKNRLKKPITENLYFSKNQTAISPIL